MVAEWMGGGSFITIHPDLCEHTGKEIYWSYVMLIIVRFTPITPCIYVYVERQPHKLTDHVARAWCWFASCTLSARMQIIHITFQRALMDYCYQPIIELGFYFMHYCYHQNITNIGFGYDIYFMVEYRYIGTHVFGNWKHVFKNTARLYTTSATTWQPPAPQ